MKVDHAKHVLTEWLNGRLEESDPQVQEALSVAEESSELESWFNQRSQFDEAISEALRDDEVPSDLKARLLESVEEAKDAAPGESGGRASVLRFPRMGWVHAVAACLILGLGVFAIMRHEEVIQTVDRKITGQSFEDFDTYRDAMAYYIADTYFQLDLISTDLNQIGDWLKRRNRPDFAQLPNPLTAKTPIGCKQIDWRGTTVSLVCFQTDEGKIVHLFILDREDAAPGMIDDLSAVARASGLQTGGWLDDEKAYLLVGSDPSVDITFALS